MRQRFGRQVLIALTALLMVAVFGFTGQGDPPEAGGEQRLAPPQAPVLVLPEEGSHCHPGLDEDRFGVLTDLTLCIGCRRCEMACAEQNGLPPLAMEDLDDQGVFDEFRRPSPTQYTVVNRFEDEEGKPTFVKAQCMHCEHAACVSACIVGALEKDPKGPVLYDSGKCIYHRYCLF